MNPPIESTTPMTSPKPVTTVEAVATRKTSTPGTETTQKANTDSSPTTNPTVAEGPTLSATEPASMAADSIIATRPERTSPRPPNSTNEVYENPTPSRVPKSPHTSAAPATLIATDLKQIPSPLLSSYQMSSTFLPAEPSPCPPRKRNIASRIRRPNNVNDRLPDVEMGMLSE